MAASTVHQCPSCDLRFASRNELIDHLAVDHPSPSADDVPSRRHTHGIVTVPVDPSRAPGPALAAAVALARAADLAVEVVAAPAPGLRTTARYLAVRQREVHAAGVATVPPCELVGDPVDAIAAHTAAGRTSLLCMATRARGRLAEPVLGSVSAAVVRSSRVPVLLIGPAVRHPGRDPARVIAGVDGSVLAGGARRAATRLADRLGVPLELAQVVAPDDSASTIAARDPHAPAVPSDQGPAIVLCDSNPVNALVERAGTSGQTILVVATHGRTGFDRLAMGSVATGLARRAHGPVLVVPRGAELDLERPTSTSSAALPDNRQGAAPGPDRSGS